MNDQKIIEKIRRGDESVLDLLYRRYYQVIIRMIIRNSGSEDEAKDIYQDALIVFWQKVCKEDFVLSSRIKTFIYGISYKLWLKELERKRKIINKTAEKVDEIDLQSIERSRIINECINELSEKCRKILTCYYFDNMKMEKIAVKLNLKNANAAKSEKYRCLMQLNKIIKSKKYAAGDFLD